MAIVAELGGSYPNGVTGAERNLSRPGTISTQQITSLSASTALTVPDGALFALIQCESQTVRFKSDATAPTASVGERLMIGQTLMADTKLADYRFIEEAASAKLNIEYYRTRPRIA